MSDAISTTPDTGTANSRLRRTSVGVQLCLAAALAAGLVFGLLLGAISQWFLIAGITSAAAGLFTGTSTLLMQSGGKRAKFAAGIAAAFISAVGYLVAFHFADFFIVQYRLGAIDPEERRVAQNFDALRSKYQEQSPEVQELINHLATDNRLRDLVAADTLPKYLQIKAQLGVTIFPIPVKIKFRRGVTIRSGGRGDKITGTRAYLYWLLEGLYFAGAGCVIPYGVLKFDSARRPSSATTATVPPKE